MTLAQSIKTSDSTMTPRQRLLAVYRGRTPDRVASLADLSYWHSGNGGGKFIPGKTDGANQSKIDKLMELHHQTGAAIHLNLGSYYNMSYSGDIQVDSGIRRDEYFHTFKTPLGDLSEIREWSDRSFSWPITHHMVQSIEDLKIIRYIFEHTRYLADWEPFHEANAKVGELGLPLVQAPYTGMGFLMSRYAGIESTVMFAADYPDEVMQTVQTINASHRIVFEQLVDGPSEVMFVSDNLSSDVQHPAWFRKYSADHYRWMAQVAHQADKPIAIHVDGRLRGILAALNEVGIDAADAVTPAPWGDITAQQCRDEAGDKFVLSGGVPPNLFHPAIPLAVFDQGVEEWLALADRSPALIIAPGDQLSPDGELDRVRRMVQIANTRRF